MVSNGFECGFLQLNAWWHYGKGGRAVPRHPRVSEHGPRTGGVDDARFSTKEKRLHRQVGRAGGGGFEEVGGGGAVEERGTRFLPLPFPAGWPVEEREEMTEGGTAGVDASSPRVASHEVTLTPHVHGTDGFYIARWVRS